MTKKKKIILFASIAGAVLAVAAVFIALGCTVWRSSGKKRTEEEWLAVFAASMPYDTQNLSQKTERSVCVYEGETLVAENYLLVEVNEQAEGTVGHIVQRDTYPALETEEFNVADEYLFINGTMRMRRENGNDTVRSEFASDWNAFWQVATENARTYVLQRDLFAAFSVQSDKRGAELTATVAESGVLAFFGNAENAAGVRDVTLRMALDENDRLAELQLNYARENGQSVRNTVRRGASEGIAVADIARVSARTFAAGAGRAAAQTDDGFEGDGSQQSPYILACADDFLRLMRHINNRVVIDGYFGKYFSLTANVDLTGAGFAPIGTALYPFCGRLNGNGYAVRGLDLQQGEYDEPTGLFGVTGVGAVVENLRVYGTVTGRVALGGIAGENGGTIRGCVNHARVTAEGGAGACDAGGIAGRNTGRVENSYNRGEITGSGTNVGGVAGNNVASVNVAGAIVQCFNAGSVRSQHSVAGGVVGLNEGNVSQCFNGGTVRAFSAAGGVAGSNGGEIADVYNAAQVVADENMAGGVCGSNDGKLSRAFNAGGVSALRDAYGVSGLTGSAAVTEYCYVSVERFDGRLFPTQTGTNTGSLHDLQMVQSDTLTNAARLGGLGAAWGKRTHNDTYCHYPELACFMNASDAFTEEFSQTCARVERQVKTDEIALGTVLYVYNGAACEPDVRLQNAVQTRGVDYACTYENNVNAGTATARVTLCGYYKGVRECTFTIQKRPLSVRWQDDPLYYTGKAQHPLAEASGAAGEECVEFAYSVAGGVLPGNHTVTAVLADTDVNRNYALAPQSRSYVILPRALRIEWDATPLFYTGKAQYPQARIAEGLAEGEDVTLRYSGYARNIGAGENYTVQVSLAASPYAAHYTLRESHVYCIARQPVTPVFSSDPPVYNGRAQYPAVCAAIGAAEGETLTFAYKNYAGNIDAGEGYTVEVFLADTSVNRNYAFGGATHTYSIEKRALTLAFGASPVYNGKPQCPAFTATGAAANALPVFAVSDYSGNVAATDGEAYCVEISLADDPANRNYTFAPLTVRYDIRKAPLSAVWDSTALVYNGAAQYPSARVTGACAGDKIAYGYTEWEDNSDVGKPYTVRLALTEGVAANANYVLDVSCRTQYTILPRPLCIRGITATSRTYNGDTAVEIAGGAAEERAGGEEIAFVLGAGRLQDAHAGNGKRVSCEITLVGEFAYRYTPVADDVRVDIRKATFDPSGLTFASQTLVADGKRKSLKVQGELPSGVRIEYSGGGSAPGAYTVTARFVYDERDYLPMEDLTATLYIRKPPARHRGVFIGIAVAAALVLCASACALLVFRRRKRRAAASVAARSLSAPTVAVPAPAPDFTPEAEVPFVLDGVPCSGKTAFIASLCYKDSTRQREICALPAEKAKACAAGKGGEKRRDLYWQGVSILRGSREYKSLLQRVDSL